MQQQSRTKESWTSAREGKYVRVYSAADPRPYNLFLVQNIVSMSFLFFILFFLSNSDSPKITII